LSKMCMKHLVFRQKCATIHAEKGKYHEKARRRGTFELEKADK
jgi:hypothetical protein